MDDLEIRKCVTKMMHSFNCGIENALFGLSSSVDTATCTIEKPFDVDTESLVDAFKRAQELVTAIPKPEIEFDSVWGNGDALEKFVDALGAKRVGTEYYQTLNTFYGPRLVEVENMPDGEVWLILSPKTPLELPKIVKIVKLD